MSFNAVFIVPSFLIITDVFTPLSFIYPNCQTPVISQNIEMFYKINKEYKKCKI